MSGGGSMKYWKKMLPGGGGKAPTPMPPVPYKKKLGGVNIMRGGVKRLDADNMIDVISPDRPHWRDARFQAKPEYGRGPQSMFNPFYFSPFSMNQDWGRTFMQIGFFTSLPLFFWGELWTLTRQEDLVSDKRIHNDATISIQPDESRNDALTERELREAGYAYIGKDQLEAVKSSREMERAKRPES